MDKPALLRAGHPRGLWAGRVAVGLLALSGLGCATQPGKSVQQEIRVETPGCPGARCEIANDRGSWAIEHTPGTVTVTTSATPLRLSCQRADGAPALLVTPAAAAPPTGKGAVVGGAVGGGAVGVGLGAAALSFIPVLGVIVVAAGVGAGAAAGQAAEAQAQALHYPATVTLPLSCGPASPAAAPAPAFGFTVRSIDAAAALAAGLPAPAPGAVAPGAVLVTEVGAGSAAAAAGMRAGDLVLAAGEHDVHDSIDLESRLRALAPGQALQLRLWRQGQALGCTLQRAAAP